MRGAATSFPGSPLERVERGETLETRLEYLITVKPGASIEMLWSPGAPTFLSWSSGAPHMLGRSPGALNPFGTLINKNNLLIDEGNYLRK